jgi:hypothetical protein
MNLKRYKAKRSSGDLLYYRRIAWENWRKFHSELLVSQQKLEPETSRNEKRQLTQNSICYFKIWE